MNSRLARIVDNSAIAIATIAATAAIQSYWGNKTTETQTTLQEGVNTLKTNVADIQKDLATVKTDVSNIKDTIFTKEDLAHVVDEMGKQSPCLTMKKRTFPFPK